MTITTNNKRLSLNEIRARVAKFAVDYKHVKNEKQHTADFWKAFMRCYGVEDSFLDGVIFEYEARRADTGHRGYIDVFQPGSFLVEQKSDGKIVWPKLGEMSNAETQARAYLLGGDITPAMSPRWVITSDFATIQLTDMNEPRTSQRRNLTLRTADLPDHVEAFLFFAGDDPDAILAEEQAEASIQAARLMGDLYAAMTDDGDTPDDVQEPDDESEETLQASIVLTRLLFLLFGDDAGLWPRSLFQRFIETRTSPDGSDLGAQLAALFDILDTPDHKRDKRADEALLEFPYVNGALYAGGTKMSYFDTAMRDALVTACKFDWSRISPAVFGSLFQTVKSKAARAQDGEHYTSEENILKTLRPLFLDDFRKRLDAADTKPKLEALHRSLTNYRYVDAACGCGNFLIVAYREMRDLELDLLVKLRAKRGTEADLVMDPSDMLNVRLDQFYGLELNWWPVKIAETAMFLVDHQANRRMEKVLGLTPQRLPITIAANIRHVNALTTNWDAVLPPAGPTTFVFGNPPFLGHESRSPEQAIELQAAWGVTKTGHLDFVTAWHAKAMTYLENKSGEFAFVTTNSITQGEPVPALFPRLADGGWHIKFAHRTFKWNSETSSKEKAAVHCVVIGFTRDATAKRRLFNYLTITSAPAEIKVSTAINGYLVDAAEVYVEPRGKPLSPDLPPVAFGSMANDGGGLLISPAEYNSVMADPIAVKYVRRFVGARELINSLDRWCLWLVGVDPADMSKSAVLRDRVEAVRAKRAASDRATTKELAKTPHLFGELRQPSVPFMCIPRHFSEDRPYATVAHFGPEVIAGDANFTCPDPDGYGFAVISSSMFITWQKTVGGRLKSDPRFAGTTTWNTLPLPAADSKLRASIILAGEHVLAARAKFPDRSLADHYNRLAMDPDLVKAHRDLDTVVDKAFGARRGALTEVDRQQTLFDRYVELLPG